MDTRLRKTLCGCAMGLGGFGFLGLGMAPVSGAISLFTTQSDFTGWSSSVTPVSVAPSVTYDYDGSTTNGAGDMQTAGPGGTGAAGSLQLTTATPGTTNLGYSYLCTIGNEATNAAFMAALDPGSIPAYSAASGYGPGTTVPYSASISLVYTIPTIVTGGNYFQMGININYDGNNYNPIFGTSVSDGTVDGLSTYTVTIPYTINARPASLTNLNFDLRSNSNYVPTSPFYVDSIQVNPSAVPEPASGLVVFGAAAGSLLWRRGKRV